MSELRYMCLLANSGVQYILMCFCFVFLRFVYPHLPVSLNFPYSVFSNIYLQHSDPIITQYKINGCDCNQTHYVISINGSNTMHHDIVVISKPTHQKTAIITIKRIKA